MGTEPSRTTDHNAACACRRVQYGTIKNADGTVSDRWDCLDCGSEFVRAHPIRATIDALRARCSALESELAAAKEERDRVLSAAVPSRPPKDMPADACWERATDYWHRTCMEMKAQHDAARAESAALREENDRLRKGSA